jgi:hypothetical protein
MHGQPNIKLNFYANAPPNASNKQGGIQTVCRLYTDCIQSCPISADSVSAVSVIHGLTWPPKKSWKIKEINGS